MEDVLDQRLKPGPDAFFNAVGDETVLLHVRNGAYFGIDPIGTTVWNGLNDGASLRDLCSTIAAEFDQPLEQVSADVRRFVEDLKANELVVDA